MKTRNGKNVFGNYITKYVKEDECELGFYWGSHTIWIERSGDTCFLPKWFIAT